MAGESQGIGGVEIDVSANMSRFTQNIKSGVATARQEISSLSKGGSVTVSVKLGTIAYSTLRNQIAAGIGVIPIQIKIDPKSIAAVSAAKRAAGGPTSGLNIVNEIGREMYVPKRMASQIPRDVMQEIMGGKQLWQAPGEGFIIPAHLKGRIPRRARGGPSRGGRPGVFGFNMPDDPFNYLSQGQDLESAFERARESDERLRAQRTRYLEGMPDSDRTGAFYRRYGRYQPVRGGPPPAPPPQALGPASPSRALAPISPQQGSGDPRFDEQQRVNRERRAENARSASIRLGYSSLFSEQSQGRGGRAFDAAEFLRQGEARISAGIQRGLTTKGGLAGVAIGSIGGVQQQRRAQLTERLVTRELQQLPALEDLSAEYVKQADRLQSLRKVSQETGRTFGFQSTQFKEQRKEVGLLVGTMRANAEATKAVAALEVKRDKAIEAARPNAARFVASLYLAGVAFTTVQQGLQFAAEAVTKAAAPAIDALTGFSATGSRVSKQIGEAARDMGGNVTAAIAASSGRAGLGTAGLAAAQQFLGPAATAKAGAAAAGEASDIRRATLALRSGSAPTGLFGGYGGLFGGPAFAEQLGGGKGFTEVIAGDVAELRRRQEALSDISDTRPLIPGGHILDPIADLFRPSPGSPAGRRAAAERGSIEQRAAAAGPGLEELQSDYNEALERGTRYLGENTSAIRLETRESLARQGVTEEQFTEMANSFVAIGTSAKDEANARQLAAGGFILFNTATRKAVDSVKEYTHANELAAQGQTLLTPQAFAQQQAQQLRAQFALSAERGRFQRESEIPARIGNQILANPFAPAGTGIADKSKVTIANLERTQDLQDEITNDAMRSLMDQQRIITQNVGIAEALEYGRYTIEAANYGKQIESLNSALANKQADLSAKQYARNIYLINRSIADAKGLLGRAGGPNNLGAIQRQQFLLGRESQQLGFQLQQRQINFQVALAGFQAPGITGEERAARKREAEIEASYAQKQLNIARELFGLEGQAFTVGARRSIQDLEAQKAITSQTFALEQEQIAVQRRINALSVKQSVAVARAESIFSQATENFGARLNSAAQGAALGLRNFAQTLGAINTELARAYGVSGTKPLPKGKGGTRGAPGYMGTVNAPTNFVFGDAGTEEVIAIRNPKRGMLPGGFGGGGGGGGMSVSVVVTGNNISSDADEDRLARKVASAVESLLGQKASLLGFQKAS